ncbi:uncharacterized protein LOC135366964 isoform X2 [Ornithodoros turicata]|uniref:uncharacterized protein LOC135366964 isoform X2 n=1 Tax=Ornithodoros turicata TaxID=34597 RepID=UPI003138CA77
MLDRTAVWTLIFTLPLSSRSYETYYLLEDCDGSAFLELQDSQSNSSVALLLSRRLPYPGNKSCSLSISAPWADGFLFVVHMINMRWESAKCLDYVQLLDEGEVLLPPLCTVQAIGSRFVALRENRLTVDVHSFQDDPSELFTGLSLTVTGYVTKSRCSTREMIECTHSEVCISRSLLCDEVDHCGDYSDEADFCSKYLPEKSHSSVFAASAGYNMLRSHLSGLRGLHFWFGP